MGLLVGLAAPGAHAAGDAGSAGAFLTQDAEARGAALGGTLGAAVDDLGALHWNPAGLARLDKPQIAFTHITLFEDTQYDFAAAGAASRWGGLGAAFIRQATGGFEQRTTPFDAPSDFSISQNAFLAGWGKQVARPLDLGVTLKSVRESIGSSAASGWGADLGAILRPGGNWLLGLALFNAAAPRLTFVSRPVTYARQWDATAAYLWRPRSDLAVLAALRLSKPDFQSASASGGVEIQYEKLAALRLGMQDKGLSTGVGVRFGNTSFDYAVLLHDLGLSHIISFTQRFGQTRAELEETISRGIRKLSASEAVRLSRAHLSEADAQLKENRLTEALRNLETAALWDPNNPDIPRRISELQDRVSESLSRGMIERSIMAARSEFERGNLLASRQYWRSVLELDPRNQEAAEFLRRIDGRLSKAEQEKLDALRREQKEAEALQVTAAVPGLWERSLFRAAALQAEKAASIAPWSAKISTVLTSAHQRLAESLRTRSAQADGLMAEKKFAPALELWEAVLKDDPSNDTAAKKAQDCRDALKEALSPETRKQVDQLYYRAVEEYLKADYKAADSLVQEILKLDPSSDSARKLKAKVDAALRIAP